MRNFKLSLALTMLGTLPAFAAQGYDEEVRACHSTIQPIMVAEYREHAEPLKNVLEQVTADQVQFLDGIKSRLHEWDSWDKDSLQAIVDEQLESSPKLSIDGQLYAPCIEGETKGKDTETCHPKEGSGSKLHFKRTHFTEIDVEEDADNGLQVRACATVKFTISDAAKPRLESATVCSALPVETPVVQGTDLKTALIGYSSMKVRGIPIEQSEDEYRKQWTAELCGRPLPTLDEAMAQVVADEAAGVKRGLRTPPARVAPTTAPTNVAADTQSSSAPTF